MATKKKSGAVTLKGGLRGREEGKLVMMRVAVGRIRPAAYNPRKDLRPGDDEWKELEGAIHAFGYVDPLVWNKQSGNLVGGHQRLKVLIARGATHVDVSVVDLEPAQEKLLNLALNKIKGGWDDARLAAVLQSLDGDDGIDVALSGFSEEETHAILEEGERLVEMLVPGREEAPRDKGTEAAEGGGEGKKATVFNLLVTCGNERKQKRLFARLSEEGFGCELRTS